MCLLFLDLRSIGFWLFYIKSKEEKEDIIDILFDRVRRIFFKIENVVLPDSNELSGVKINLCNVFKTQYMTTCKNDIVSDKR